MEPGGLWDSGRFEVRARIKRDGAPAGEIELRYAGTASQFEGTVEADRPGTYEATVYAYDPSNGNTGLDGVTFIVSP